MIFSTNIGKYGNGNGNGNSKVYGSGRYDMFDIDWSISVSVVVQTGASCWPAW